MIHQFLVDQQDEKVVEKIYPRLLDILGTGEEILYIAVQKKPIVNVMADAVAITNKRVIFFSPTNFGISIKIVDFLWKDIADVAFREEILGALFIIKTYDGTDVSVDYIPKQQARKLYQHAHYCREVEAEAQRQQAIAKKTAEAGGIHIDKPVNVTIQAVEPEPPQPEPIPDALAEPLIAEPVFEPVTIEPVVEPISQASFIQEQAPVFEEDALTLKLRKLKTLYDQNLITLDDYNKKKADLLDYL